MGQNNEGNDAENSNSEGNIVELFSADRSDNSNPNVVTLYEVNIQNIPAMMRKLADAIEEGKYGDVGQCAVCILGDSFETFGWGQESEPATTAIMLQAGAHRMITAIAEWGHD